MAKKPIIGVTPLWDGGKNSIWMLPGYMNAIRKVGGVAIIFPLVASKDDLVQLCDMCDGFLLTGGDDVDPALYNHTKSKKCGTPNPTRDELERVVFEYALDHDRPILGICRGIQLINALCGGDLYQDLPSEYKPVIGEPAIGEDDLMNGLKSGRTHQMTPPYDQVWHNVEVIENTPLHNLVTQKHLGVNSYHHQAIKTLAPNLETMAVAEDGVIEAVYMPSKSFVWAVQWHPEFNFEREESSRQIMKLFIEKCSKP